MGSKKRGPDSVEGEVEVVDGQLGVNSTKGSEHLRKKIKKEKKKETKTVDESSAPSTSAVSVKPMERKKKRKAVDKEKHRSSKDNAADEMKRPSKLVNSESSESKTVAASSSSSGLPEFHIDVFKDLGSIDLAVREAAAEKLVLELQEVQIAYDKLDKKDVMEGGLNLEAKKDDGLNTCAPSLRYAVRRLIRGVSSSRECARQGFALGLTLLVGAAPSISVEALLKLIVDLLEISSSMKGQEIRDCLLGRLFAYGALARSGRLTKVGIADLKPGQIKEFTSLLISLAAKKRYLQEPSVLVVLELVEKLPVEVVLNQVLEAPGLHEWFEAATETGNPDALLLALKLREKLYVDNNGFGKLLPYPYTSGRFFSADHLSSVADCLKESTFCQPRVHGVWPVLINILLPDVILQNAEPVSGLNSTKKPKKNRKLSSNYEEAEKNLRCFWDIVVEGSLLLSSHERKHLAFDVLLLLLPRLPSSCIPIVLSYKLVQCLMDVLSTNSAWLFKFAQYFLKELSDWASYDDGRRVAVIVALQKHSNGKFDCITRTKTVKELMSGFKTESGCMLFIQNLMDMFLDVGHASEEPSDQSQTTDDNSEIGSIEDKDSGTTPGTSDFLKSWVVDSLPSVIKHLKLDPEANFRVQKEILKFLAVQGLFSSSLGTEVTSFELQEKFRWPKAATSNALCRMCIEQLQLLLANAQKGEGPHAVASGLEANDLGSYFMRFLTTLHNIPSVSLFRSLSKDDEDAFKKIQAMEARLSREERNSGLSSDANRFHALRYLLIQLLLQLLLQPGEFSESASELEMCCKRAFPSTDLNESSGEDEPDGDGIPQWIDVLIDTLLSLLPHSSAPMRSAIEQVFKYFSGDVTENGLMRMLQVIKKDLKPPRHQDAEDEDEEDSDEDDLLGIEEEEDSDEAETGETGESDGQADGSEAGAGFAALGEQLTEASDDSDGGMDDEAMFRMDSYLAQIFKENRNQVGGETTHAQLVLFKLRVLSLLEIYLHENQGNSLVFKVFSNLVQAFINTHISEGSEQLGQRLWGILQKKIYKAKHYPKGDSVTISMLEPLLERNLKLAAKQFKKKKPAINSAKKKQSASFTRYKMISSLAQNSTFWLLKIIDARNFSEIELKGVFEILQDALVAYFDSKKSQLRPEFLKEIFRRWPWIGHHFLGFLLEKCSSTKSQFRQVEGLDLVMEILKPVLSVHPAGTGAETGKKMVISHLTRLCDLIKQLVTNMPEKQSRRAEVRKFCCKIFNMVRSLNLSKSFLETLDSDAHASCESQLGKAFLDLKRQEV